MTGDDYEEMKSRLAEQAEQRDAAGWLLAQVELDCANPLCGMSIHVGDPIILGDWGYCHPVCDAEHALDVAAEMRGDADRERG